MRGIQTCSGTPLLWVARWSACRMSAASSGKTVAGTWLRGRGNESLRNEHSMGSYGSDNAPVSLWAGHRSSR